MIEMTNAWCVVIALQLFCDVTVSKTLQMHETKTLFHGGSGPVLLLMLKDILKCIHH